MRDIKINLTTEKIKDFVKTTGKYASDIDVVADRTVVDGKSILGLYALDLTQNIYARIHSDNVAEYRKFEAEMEEKFR